MGLVERGRTETWFAISISQNSCMVSSKLVGNGSLNCLLLSLVMVSFSPKYDYSMFTRVQGDVIIVILV